MNIGAHLRGKIGGVGDICEIHAPEFEILRGIEPLHNNGRLRALRSVSVMGGIILLSF